MMRDGLTSLQIEKLLAYVKGKPQYVFVMLGLYAGLRQGEILALQWDCVFLGCEHPYISVRKTWRIVQGKAIVSSEVKTPSANRNVLLVDQLVQCLREMKKETNSQYVVSSSDGGPLSPAQFKRFWQPIETYTSMSEINSKEGSGIVRTTAEMVNEKRACRNKGKTTLDQRITPHLLRHTYVLNQGWGMGEKQ